MNTLLLDPTTWDLLVDSSGNIAMASDPYSQAQDAASAIKLFEGELYYDTLSGVPYWSQILGLSPPLSLMKAKFNSAALTVPGVTTANTFITSYVNRVVSGQVQITNSDSNSAAVAF